MCPAGTYRQQSGGVQITSCTPCPPGHVSEEGSTSCTECLAGEYSPGPGVSQCQKCPPGSYQENPGSTGCNLCKRGEYQDEVGSSSCKLCNIHMTKTGSIDCSGKQTLHNHNDTSCIAKNIFSPLNLGLGPIVRRWCVCLYIYHSRGEL